MNDIDTLLTSKQLQELLQVDRITIYRMLQDGRLQGFKVGGQWRFSRQAIKQWLQEQRAILNDAQPREGADSQHPSAATLPISCIRAIQDVFAEALGIGTVTTAVDGTPLTPVAHSCAFCTRILDTEVGRKRCVGSWQAAAAETGDTPRLATCHAGLSYVWGRIEIHGRFVAATHAGQFLSSSPTGSEWQTRLADLASTTGISRQELHKALVRVPVLDETRQQQVPHLLHRVTTTFSEIGEERFNLLARLRRIAEITKG